MLLTIEFYESFVQLIIQGLELLDALLYVGWGEGSVAENLDAVSPLGKALRKSEACHLNSHSHRYGLSQFRPAFRTLSQLIFCQKSLIELCG